MLHLNLPTVSNCVAVLLDAGEIVEEGYAESTGGRKPQLLENNSPRGSVVGLTFPSRGIRVYTVGVGTPAGQPIPIVDEKGTVTGTAREKDGVTPIMSKLNETLLKDVADDRRSADAASAACVLVIGVNYLTSTPGPRFPVHEMRDPRAFKLGT